ncbi:hypothetical protein LPJ79_005896, partial [Coemansia sp. RSA 1821]
MAALMYKIDSLLDYSYKLYGIYGCVVEMIEFENIITAAETTPTRFIINKDKGGDIAVSLTDCCFSWNDYNLDIPSLHIRHGEFVTVVGKVGS